MESEARKPKKWQILLSSIFPLLGSLFYYLLFNNIFGAIQVAVVLFIALSSLMYSPIICCLMLVSFVGAYFVWGVNQAYIVSLIVYGILYIFLVGIRKSERKKLTVLIVISIMGILLVSYYLLAYSQNEVNWNLITSFSAHEKVTIGNQTFESYVNFTKPSYISRADYQNGKFLQKVIIENNTELIFTINGTFTFNVTKETINALDPFAAILNGITEYSMTRNGNILVLKPINVSQPTYEVLIGEDGLPKKILIKKRCL
ncbi:MAG: hypothetical protein J7K48_08525 [Thermococcus sp.]|nr:hypothetical protein [Thermococcus sp.]